MKINIYATLRQIVGQKTVEYGIDYPVTVRGLIDEIVQIYPGLRRELIDENGEIYQHVHVLVNGRDAPYLENAYETQVMQDDTVNIFPAVGGG